MTVFTAAPHEDILRLLFQVTLLLITARTLGEIMQRLGQPAVIGEILSGVLLGPSVLSGLFPALGYWVIPQTPTQGYLLEVFSMIGAMFLLLITGLETDLRLIRKRARMAIGVSWGGILVTFGSGFLLGQWLPDVLLVDPQNRLVFSLFVATAMSISAIPVIAKVLMELNMMRRDIGQTIIAAGMSDDTIGWILLSIVAGLASGVSVSLSTVGQSVGSVVLFMGVSFTLGRWLVKKTLDFVQDQAISTNRMLTLVIILTLGWGAFTQALHLEAVLGAFIMGVLLAQMPRLPREIPVQLENITLGVFAPIFFAVAGLKVNLPQLFTPHLLGISVLVIAVASLGKIIGTYLGARLIGKCDHWTALSFGVGLNARGAMEIIIATIGLSLGILTQEMFSVIVLMAITTSLMAPLGLRWVLQRIIPDQEELQRLRLEELTQDSRIAGIHRVLLPIRPRLDGQQNPIQIIQSKILERMKNKLELSLTLLTVTQPEQKQKSLEFLEMIRPQFAQQELLLKVIEHPKPDKTILKEVEKHYDLLVLGAPQQGQSETRFNNLIDDLVRLAPCQTLIIQSRSTPPEHWEPQRILVPTNGTTAARHAVEFAFFLAASSQSEVTLLHVVEKRPDRYYPIPSDHTSREVILGYQILEKLRELGDSLAVDVLPVVQIGEETPTMILKYAHHHQIDLIMMGTQLRTGTTQLFLGKSVEMILEKAQCPVVIINTI